MRNKYEKTMDMITQFRRENPNLVIMTAQQQSVKNPTRSTLKLNPDSEFNVIIIDHVNLI